MSFKPGPVIGNGANYGNPEVLTASQGSGNTSFSFRVLHGRNLAWLTLPPSGDENWTNGASATQYFEILPAFTQAEKQYWETTGVVIPLDLSQAASVRLGTPWSTGRDNNYGPLAPGNVQGGSGPGTRPDLGYINEYSSQALIRGTPDDWLKARLYSLSAGHYYAGASLNEATGRIAAWNNGPPTGPAGNGIGGAYPALGAPFPSIMITDLPQPPADNVGGLNGNVYSNALSQTDTAHEPSFTGLAYAVFGSRHFLDLIYLHGNRTLYAVQPYNDETYRDNTIGTNHFYGLFVNCCQIRGSAWSYRDKTSGAVYGADSNPESLYYNDVSAENNNYHKVYLAWKDGAGNSNFSNSYDYPDYPGDGSDTFIADYVIQTAAMAWMATRDPLAHTWLTKAQKYIEGCLGEQAAGHPSAFWCLDYSFTIALHDGDHSVRGPGIGQYMNGTDLSDWGSFEYYTQINSGGQLQTSGGTYGYMAAGDTVKSINGALAFSSGVPAIDQLPGNTWFTITNIDNTAGTFQILCPAGHAVDATCPHPGTGPFTGFTRGGVPVTNEFHESLLYRLAYGGNGTGFSSPNYAQYGGASAYALQIAGFPVPHAIANFQARGGPSFFNSTTQPSNVWDLNAVVP